jgi:hypothetical protein
MCYITYSVMPAEKFENPWNREVTALLLSMYILYQQFPKGT